MSKNEIKHYRLQFDEMERYTHMTDSIFYEILRSTDPALKNARNCLQRIQDRKLYQFIGEVNPAIVEDSENNELSFSQKKISIDDVYNELIEFDKGLEKNDLLVRKAVFSFGKKDKNPIESMKFFGKDGKFKIPKLNKLSSLFPSVFKEEYIRVYCKTPGKYDAAKTAFIDWCSANGFKQSDE